MIKDSAQFAIGQIVNHKLFGYRGVVADVDAFYQGSDEWYEVMALSKPPKDRPWYHILVDGTAHVTYVAEKNIELDDNSSPISHPEIPYFFTDYESGKYIPRIVRN